VSWNSPARIQIYFFKTLIPIAGALVLLQGIAEATRCVVCLRTGAWPPRLHDVEETETMALHQQEKEAKLLKKESEIIEVHDEIKKEIRLSENATGKGDKR
jgi:hypothetical protein